MKKRKRRKLYPNPQWVDAVMVSVWDELHDLVGPDALPVPYSSGGQIPMTFKEYGCGTWGCAYPTNTKGLVVKVTTDRTEAAFVQLAIDLARKHGFPVGIVQFHMVTRIDGIRKGGHDIFVIWREGLGLVGKKAMDRVRRESGFRQVSEFMERLNIAMMAGRFIGDDMNDDILDRGIDANSYRRLTRDFGKQIKSVADLDMDDMVQSVLAYESLRQMEKDPVGAIALASANYIRVVRELENTGPTTAPVASAMDYYFQNGVIFGDVRDDNLGWAKRPGHPHGTLVITDPGLSSFPTDPSIPDRVRSTHELEEGDWLVDPAVMRE